MLADHPAITRDKSICIQTTHGQVFVSPKFDFQRDLPMHGMVTIVDGPDVYWFNQNEVVWIGPRQ